MTPKGWQATATLDDAVRYGLTEKEYRHILDVLGREISLLEVGICAALYSEHCSYKSTKTHLKTLPTGGPRVLQGPGENAGVLDIGNGLAVVFKVESHNHPTFIEPFQGAATGVGGILRDVFTMGARPLALMNSLRFGSLSTPRTKYLLKRAVAGIGSYGNCMGIPTVGGELFFHPAYDGNCLVNAFALGVVRHEKVFYGRASGVGNPLLYVGSKTGRDGIHGATMASEVFGDNSEEKRPTVQVGDPFQEKLLLEACLEAMNSGAVVGIQDMGAAGLTSSGYEMAERAGNGMRLHLDRVPQREQDMTPYEIMLSESQERMLLVVDAKRIQEVIKIITHWELDAVVIGEVIEGSNVELFWHGELVSSLPAAVLTSSVPQYRWAEEKPADFAQRISFSVDSLPEPDDLSAIWQGMLSSVGACSRYPVYRQYDSTVRSNTVVHPGGDAAVIRLKPWEWGVEGPTEKGIAMTLDCNSRYCSIDPRHGAALSVSEACRNITAVGAVPIGISDGLNNGSPERLEGMWEIAETIRGLGDAARAYGIPIISGNVSLYNETKGRSILPTPVIAMVGLIEDASLCVSATFVADGDVILLLGETGIDGLGGSEYLAYHFGVEKGALPALHYDLEQKTAGLVRELIHGKLLKSCHDISSGGLAVAFAECCFGTYACRGARLTIEAYTGRRDALLFSESGARYIVSCDRKAEEQVRSRARACGISVSASGRVGGEKIEIARHASLDLAATYSAWKWGLEEAFE